MKLYKVTCTSPEGKPFAEFTSSEGAASKVRTRLKKLGMRDISKEEVQVETDRAGLIVFLNKLGAHESWIPDAVADAPK